jgi:NitT/TauT family transport system permease protein
MHVSGRRRAWNLRIWQLAAVLALVLAWAVVYLLRIFSPDLIPSPWDVAVQFVLLATEATFWLSVWNTLYSALVALLLAILVGVPLGMLLGINPTLYRYTQLLIDLGRSFPTVALLPVLILVIGANNQMKIVVIFLGVVWPILLQTFYGARRLDPVIADTVRSYQIPRGLKFVKVVLPNAAPFAVTGIRIAAAAAILIALGVEVLSLTPGMGGSLARAQADGAPAVAMAYVLWAAEGRLLAWSRRGKGGNS